MLFPDSALFACIKFSKLETYVILTEIYQNCPSSLKCTFVVHFLAKLSNLNWILCVFYFLTFLKFDLLYFIEKIVVQKYQKSSLFLHNVQNF